MAESFSRWESDPLFSAAEVVQDSADRMESLYRTLVHDQSLVQEDPSDSRLLSSLQYHRRDLGTALETTRWQLEDFEREVNFAALSVDSKSREIAILKHRQFIRAIREHIIQVEKSVQDSLKKDSLVYPLCNNLNEQDEDTLTSFLSGGNFRENSSSFETGSNSTSRLIESNTEHEIIELKSDEVEVLTMNGTKSLDEVYSSLGDHIPWRSGSHVQDKHGKNWPALFQGSGGHNNLAKAGSYDLEIAALGAKYYSYQNRIRESTWGFLRNFWLGNDSKSSFMKRRKDGDITRLQESNGQRMTSSSSMTSLDQQGTIHECLISFMQYFPCVGLNQRRSKTSRFLNSYSQITLRLMFILLIAVGSLGIWTAWRYIFKKFIPTFP